MPTTTPPTTMVRLPRSLVEQIRTIADAHDRSISAELRVALSAYVRRSMPEAERILKERSNEQDD